MPIKESFNESQKNQEWKTIVNNLGNGQTSIGSSFRIAIESQNYDLFNDCMDAYIQEKENEIYDVCNVNYKEFIDSVQEIVKIKLDIKALQTNAQSCNGQVQEVALKVQNAAENVVNYQKLKLDTENALENIEKAMKLVEAAKVIDEYIKTDKLFHAIRTLETLKEDCLPFRNDEFGIRMEKWISTTSSLISSQAKETTQRWLTRNLELAQKIGHEALNELLTTTTKPAVEEATKPIEKESPPVKQTNAPIAPLPTKGKENTTKLAKSTSSLRKNEKESMTTTATPTPPAKPPTSETTPTVSNDNKSNSLELPSLRLLRLEASEFRKKQAAKTNYRKLIIIELSPLFRSLQVFSYLDQLELFQDFYEQRRIPQFELSRLIEVDMTTITLTDLLQKLPILIERIIGTFAIERVLCEGTNGVLLEKEKLESLFRRTIQQFVLLLDRSMKSPLISTQQFLTMRSSLLHTAIILGDTIHQYDIETIIELLRLQWPTFAHIVVEEIKLKIKELITNDTLEIANLTTTDDLKLMTTLIGEEKKSLQFTKAIWQSIQFIYGMIQQLYQYAQSIRCPDWLNIARISLFDCLTYLNQMINTIQLDHALDQQISYSIQIAVNTTTIVSICPSLDLLVKTQAEQLGGEIYTISTTGTEFHHRSLFIITSGSIDSAIHEFQHTTTRAQDIVCELMVKKIDSLCSSTFDFAPLKARNLPHQEITDLIEYLDVAFNCLVPLPETVKIFVYISSCAHITKILMDMLMKTKRINMGGLLDLRLSLDALYVFAKRYDTSTRLNDTFSSLDQTLKLLFSGEIERILDPKFATMEEYNSVQISQIITILEKYQENLTMSLQWNSNLTVVLLRKQKIDPIIKQWKASHGK